MSTLAERVTALREKKGLNQSELGRRIRVSPQAIQKLEAGKTESPRFIVELARELGVSPDYLKTGVATTLTKVPGSSGKVESVPVRGTVKAGQWQAIEDWELEVDEHVPSSSEYPIDWQYAFIVEGESLNKIANSGDRLVCVDLIASGISIKDEDLVVVERSRDGGQLIERTAKRVRQTIRGIELWPESTHPAHQTPIEYLSNDDPEHNSVRILAKVIWILRKP